MYNDEVRYKYTIQPERDKFQVTSLLSVRTKSENGSLNVYLCSTRVWTNHISLWAGLHSTTPQKQKTASLSTDFIICFNTSHLFATTSVI